ncbi:MAG: hypothetical protein GX115_17360 [Ruminiclostridium sp.]|nr:hypothetical protein [Ruminiclostridium sp.]
MVFRKALKWWHILTTVLVIAFAGLVIYLFSILNQKTIYQGISVDGVEVGGLTRQAALVLLRENQQAAIPGDGILLMTPLQQYRLPFHDIHYEAEYGKALDLAWSRGREGNVLQRLREINNLRRQGLPIVAGMCYDKDKIIRILDSIRQDIERKPKNASVSVKSGNIKVTPHQTGYIMDMKLSLERVEESLLKRTLQDVQLCVIDLTPDITEQMLDKITTRLAQFQTTFSTTNEGRVHNIKTACGKIDQQLLLPGEVFSMDRALGDRTEKNGYRNAKVIVNNELVDGLGGGICQVTSTFYNAVLLSGLEVVERRNHTIPLTYIDVGRDATISQGYIDFKFKNNLSYAVLVDARIYGNQVNVSIWGRKPQTEYKYRIRTKITEKTRSEGVETWLDPSLKPGEVVVVREAVPGCKVEVYRETVDSSGKVIQTEKISVDKYLPQKRKIKMPPISAIDFEEAGDITKQQGVTR